jgi:hypothetical protein
MEILIFTATDELTFIRKKLSPGQRDLSCALNSRRVYGGKKKPGF